MPVRADLRLPVVRTGPVLAQVVLVEELSADRRDMGVQLVAGDGNLRRKLKDNGVLDGFLRRLTPGERRVELG